MGCCVPDPTLLIPRSVTDRIIRWRAGNRSFYNRHSMDRTAKCSQANE
jgi:hypothetical protein